MTTGRFAPAGRRSAPCTLSRTRLNTAPPASACGSGARGTNPFACITSGAFFTAFEPTARHAPPPQGRWTLRAARGRFVDAPCPAAHAVVEAGLASPDDDRAVGSPAPEVAAASCVTGFSSPAPLQRNSRALGHSDSLGYGLDDLAPLYPPGGESAAPHCKAGQGAPLFFQKWLKLGA